MSKKFFAMATAAFLIIFFQNCQGFNADITELSSSEYNTVSVSLASSSNDFFDYLVRDVCIDDRGLATNEDPYVCRRKRNIGVGESLTYITVDHSSNGIGYQALSSLPIYAPNGELRVIHVKDFGVKSFLKGKFDYDIYSGDGFDLMEVNGPYASFIRTMDGGCLDQMIYGKGNSKEDAWILFSNDILEKRVGSVNHEVSIERLIAKSGCEKLISSKDVRTVWDYRTSFPFQSGKVMSVLDSFHYAHSDLSRKNNALERYLFTKEYGFTRWEAWIPRSRCLEDFKDNVDSRCNISSKHILNGRCDNLPRQTVWGGQEWVMTDCRDSTFYRSLEKAYYPLNDSMAKGDIVVASLNAPLSEAPPEKPKAPPIADAPPEKPKTPPILAQPEKPKDPPAPVAPIEKPKLLCIAPWEQKISQGESLLAYQSPSVDFGQKCLHEKRTCTNDGLLSGTYTFRSCNEVNSKIFSFRQMIPNGAHEDDYGGAGTGATIHTGKGLSPRHFMYGPYISLERGNYSASFELLIDVATRNFNEKIATIDVVANVGKTILSSVDLYRRDFKQDFVYSRKTLDFGIDSKTDNIEFRVFWHGNTYLRFKEVHLIKK